MARDDVVVWASPLEIVARMITKRHRSQMKDLLVVLGILEQLTVPHIVRNSNEYFRYRRLFGSKLFCLDDSDRQDLLWFMNIVGVLEVVGCWEIVFDWGWGYMASLDDPEHFYYDHYNNPSSYPS